MKYLIAPGSHSSSHAAKAVEIQRVLNKRGHQTCLAVASNHVPFLDQLGVEHRLLPDLPEADGRGYPTQAWFRQPGRIAACIRAETDLIQSFRPDRLIGVWRFTLWASARLASLPLDTLNCACMLPDFPEVLGFLPGEAGREDQREHLRTFFGLAGRRLGTALAPFGLEGPADVRSMLLGDRTFLWDTPEFQPVPVQAGVTHVGPIAWQRRPAADLDLRALGSVGRPIALLTFGTCVGAPEATVRLSRLLVGLGYHVVLGAGGQAAPPPELERLPHLTPCDFAPLDALMPMASLLVCHGGQMTVFEGLAQGIPCLVMPFQPEQAHNGVALERLGRGRRLLPARPFQGSHQVYLDALEAMDDEALAAAVASAAAGGRQPPPAWLADYRGTEALADHLEDC